MQIEENNRMGKTKDLLREIRATKGTFHAKMSTIMNRNRIELIEAKHTKNTQDNHTKKIFITQIIMMV